MKYSLSKIERKRFSELAAMEAAFTATKAELKELNALDRKRSKLWERSPAGRKSLKIQRASMRKVEKMARDLDRLLQ